MIRFHLETRLQTQIYQLPMRKFNLNNYRIPWYHLRSPLIILYPPCSPKHSLSWFWTLFSRISGYPLSKSTRSFGWTSRSSTYLSLHLSIFHSDPRTPMPGSFLAGKSSLRAPPVPFEVLALSRKLRLSAPPSFADFKFNPSAFCASARSSPQSPRSRYGSLDCALGWLICSRKLAILRPSSKLLVC